VTSAVVTDATNGPFVVSSPLPNSLSLSGTLSVTGATILTALATLANGLSLTEISTPSAPSAGSLLAYSKSGDKVATLNSAGAEQILGMGIPGATFVTIKNNSGTPNSKADITVAGIATLVNNSTGLTQFVNAPNSGAALTCNLLTTGANGIDTGGVTNSAPVYFYGIYNQITATWATLGSVTSPTAGGPSLPAGYTHQVFLGEMMVDGSSHLRPTYQAGRRVTYTTPPSITPGTVTYANFFPATSEAALVQGSTATIANDTWSVTDMNGNTIFNMGSLPSGSGEAITNIVTVPNTGGTTFTAGGTGSSFTAYGWITRANVT
jgi:hypothetical protein